MNILYEMNHALFSLRVGVSFYVSLTIEYLLSLFCIIPRFSPLRDILLLRLILLLVNRLKHGEIVATAELDKTD